MNKNDIKKAKGFTEYSIEDQKLFDDYKTVIGEVFYIHGFDQVETPVVELSKVLLHKEGGDTTKEVFRIPRGESKDKELALRFDHTIPLARYYTEHAANISLPFRRSVIGKIWRAENTQKGRYREFYQADVDIVGGDVVISDAQVLCALSASLTNLDVDFELHISSRKILDRIFDNLNITDNRAELMRIVDKLDKLPEEKILELCSEYIGDKSVELLKEIDKKYIVSSLEDVSLIDIDVDLKDELYKTMEYYFLSGLKTKNVVLNLSLVRGFDYYTGLVFEYKLKDVDNTTIAGGGRYDNLLGAYSKEQVSSVGGSIGLSRLFDLTRHANIDTFEDRVIIVSEDGQHIEMLELLNAARSLGLSSYIYSGELKKGLTHANRTRTGYVCFVNNDRSISKYVVKNMEDSTQLEFNTKEQFQQFISGY